LENKSPNDKFLLPENILSIVQSTFSFEKKGKANVCLEYYKESMALRGLRSCGRF
jgi:hypothetical protein